MVTLYRLISVYNAYQRTLRARVSATAVTTVAVASGQGAVSLAPYVAADRPQLRPSSAAAVTAVAAVSTRYRALRASPGFTTGAGHV